MKNFKLTLLLAFSAISAQQIFAQQVYEARHYASPGDIYLYNRFSSGFSNQEITVSGANITWDLSSHTELNTRANQVLDHSAAINQFNFLTICALSGLSTFGCLEVWNDTDQALLLNDSLELLDFVLSNVQRFQGKESNELLENFFGFTVDLGGTFTQAVIVYQQPDTIMRFPVQYTDAWTSRIKFGIDLSPAGQNVILQSNQSRTTTIDGWGTVYTPYDTFENVLRLRSDVLRLDTIVSDTGTLALKTNQVEYMWLDTLYALPVMKATGLMTEDDSVIITTVEYIYERTCPVPTWMVDAGSDVFYLDTSGMVTIDFNILNSNADVYDWDLGDGQFAQTSGSLSHTYTSVGDYSVVIGGCMTNCLPLNTCGFQIVDFLIIDSTTSITPIDGKSVGVNIFPNPADDYLTVSLPPALGRHNYQIVDIFGRPLATGLIDHNFFQIGTKSLTSGMYTLRLSPSNATDAPMLVMRFMISR